jgi:hypothetical protein
MEIHEQKVINNFFVKNIRERAAYLLSDPKKRGKFLMRLAHFNDFQKSVIVPIVPNEHFVQPVYNFLKGKGAPDICYVISENHSLDKRYLNLYDTLKEVIGYDQGTIISCVPGELAYYEGEDDRFFLIG